MSLEFPKNFFWGAATSAHQVEGGNHNDWTEWEGENAERLAGEAAKKEWPDFLLKNYPNPLQKENYISGKACDHYNRFREDFDIARELGHNAHRFSIEWSRIEPEEGKFDAREIEHYREVIKALRERGIEPFVTLWHFTLPVWVSKKGGWESENTIDQFVKYCECVADSLREDVVYWIPINEPALWSRMAYGVGVFPPGEKNILKAVGVYLRLVRAHRKVYRALKKIRQSFEIGTAENMTWIDNFLLRGFVNHFRNFYFLRKASQEIDFAGINYYRKMFGRPSRTVSDRGWEVYPQGLYKELLLLRRFRKPIFITENGIADARDAFRGEYIKEHLEMMKKAIRDGVDIRGYLHWSLLDNFEIEEGFWPRFGLVEVDYKTMERKIRSSAWEYAKLIKKSAIEKQ